jgi:hypothetical protein
MNAVYIIMKQNTKGPREAMTTNKAYVTRETAQARADLLKKQTRLTGPGRVEKPDFWVEKITLPVG